MKERPIILSTEEVREVLANSKVHVRRLAQVDLSGRVVDKTGQKCWHADDPDAVLACPYTPDDRLWVKETLVACRDTPLDSGEVMPICAYQADGAHLWGKKYRQPWVWRRKRLSSASMPYWACRIRLRVVLRQLVQNGCMVWALDCERIGGDQ